ncbi:hypothetical protein HK100_002613 [Physocladia obscura]|uniref:Uncharacterized protein n=1 Tax=Physocladia obscura TaxID=109957 RepID=A0AAD5T814_9FUNG|nr:hypothetical protein HK100_002613 [Physocladia obscura]
MTKITQPEVKCEWRAVQSFRSWLQPDPKPQYPSMVLVQHSSHRKKTDEKTDVRLAPMDFDRRQKNIIERKQIIELIRHCAVTEDAKEKLAEMLEKVIAERDKLQGELHDISWTRSLALLTKDLNRETASDSAKVENVNSICENTFASPSNENPEMLVAKLLAESLRHQILQEPPTNETSNFSLSFTPRSSILSNRSSISSNGPQSSASSKSLKNRVTEIVNDEWSSNYIQPPTTSVNIEQITQKQKILTFDALIQTDEVVDSSNSQSQRKNLANATSLKGNETCASTNVASTAETVLEAKNSPINSQFHDDSNHRNSRDYNTQVLLRELKILKKQLSNLEITNALHQQTRARISTKQLEDQQQQKNGAILKFSDLDPKSIEHIEYLIPSDNSLLFTNDTSMIKSLSEVVRDVEAMSTNPIDETWQIVADDVLVRRQEIAAIINAEEERLQKKELLNRIVQICSDSDEAKTHPNNFLEESISQELDSVIFRMNGLKANSTEQ